MANNYLIFKRLFHSIGLIAFAFFLISLPSVTPTGVISKHVDDHATGEATRSTITPTTLPCNAKISFSELLIESIRDIENFVRVLFENISHNLKDNTPPFEWVRNLKELLLSTVQLFENRLLSFGDNLLRELFGTAVAELKYEFHMLVLSLNDELKALNETIINNSDTIDMWAAKIKDELRGISNTYAYNISCNVMNDIIDFSTDQLRNCCNINIRPSRLLCSKVRGLFSHVILFIVDVLDRIQRCLEDKESYYDWNKSCIKLAFDYTTAAVVQVTHTWRNIKTLVKSRLIFNTPISSCCFSIMVVQVRHRKNWIDNWNDAD